MEAPKIKQAGDEQRQAETRVEESLGKFARRRNGRTHDRHGFVLAHANSPLSRRRRASGGHFLRPGDDGEASCLEKGVPHRFVPAQFFRGHERRLAVSEVDRYVHVKAPIRPKIGNFEFNLAPDVALVGRRRNLDTQRPHITQKSRQRLRRQTFGKVARELLFGGIRKNRRTPGGAVDFISELRQIARQSDHGAKAIRRHPVGDVGRRMRLSAQAVEPGFPLHQCRIAVEVAYRLPHSLQIDQDIVANLQAGGSCRFQDFGDGAGGTVSSHFPEHCGHVFADGVEVAGTDGDLNSVEFGADRRRVRIRQRRKPSAPGHQHTPDPGRFFIRIVYFAVGAAPEFCPFLFRLGGRQLRLLRRRSDHCGE